MKYQDSDNLKNFKKYNFLIIGYKLRKKKTLRTYTKFNLFRNLINFDSYKNFKKEWNRETTISVAFTHI